MKKDKYRGSLELKTLDQLNSISSNIKDVRGLAILLNEYFYQENKPRLEKYYEFYGVLNECIIQRMNDIAKELSNIVSEIEVKK